jgi:hypothetical protein
MTDREKIEKLSIALQIVLDQVDYTARNCSPTDMVAAVLDISVIKIAKQALEEAK